MAVSQYLRPESLLEAMRTHLTPGLVHNASSVIGESEPATRQALSSAVPSILGGITRLASSPDGTTGLANMVREGGYDSLVSNPAALFSGGGTTSKLMGIGQQLLTRIFGTKVSAVSDVVAKSSGVSSNSATKLMSLVAPLTMGVLSRHLISQELDTLGLSKLLSEQKDEIAGAEPPGLSRVLDSSGPTVVAPPAKNLVVDTERSTYQEGRQEYSSSSYVPVEAKRTGGLGGKVPWLLLAMIVLGLIVFLRGRSVRHAADIASQHAANAGNAIGNVARGAEGALAGITLPGGVHITLPQGSINYNLATYLGSGAPVPKTFVFDHLNFDSSSTNLTPDSLSTVNNLAAVLKAYPNSRVQLAGYTDNTGNPQDNRRLSQDRAEAVKGMLAERGVNSDRVTAVGLGEDHPIAPNDTEEGKAKNRRLELTVTTK